jgi:hypothetical protein
MKACSDTYLSVYMALDRSGSMGAADNRLAVLKDAVELVLDEFEAAIEAGLVLDLAMNWWAEVASETSALAVDASDIDAFRTTMAGITHSTYTPGSTHFDEAVEGAVDWFTDTVGDATIDRRIFIFMTDGKANPESTALTAETLAADMLTPTGGSFNTADGTAIEMYGFNILLTDVSHTKRLDNTADDGVPVITTLTADTIADLLIPILECSTGIPASSRILD